MTRPAPQPLKHRNAFTLVELLVAIAIIGILMAIAVPATMSAVRRARVASIRIEISALEKAIEQYQQKYGDYPPDFSNLSVVQRHYRKLFPRMSADESAMFNALINSSSFYPNVVNRAEVLVFTLGGYSDDLQRPFSGDGGPLQWVGDGATTYADASSAERRLPANYQINTERPNSLYDFDQSRLNYSEIDESQVLSATNRYTSVDDGDLFLTYVSRPEGAPIIYFDSRTYDYYDTTATAFNGYAGGDFGVARPYLSDKINPRTATGNYGSIQEALQSFQFINPNTFQIISSGLDNNFGVAGSGSSARQIFFQYPTGRAIEPLDTVSTPDQLYVADVVGYQEAGVFGGTENPHFDNITNFSNAELVDDVP